MTLTLAETMGGRLLVASGGIVLAIWVAKYWGFAAESVDRLFIPCASVWLLWRDGARLSGLPRRPELIGLLPIGLGCLAAPPAVYLHAQVGPRPILLWWYAAAWLSAVAGWLLVERGWQFVRAVAFPALLALLALPTPNRILLPLQHYLQTATAWLAAAVVPWCGVPVERSGFVLMLPSGDLGVAEACSGVRAVNSLVALAAVAAYWGRFGWVRGALVVALALPVVVAANAGRVILGGVLQEWLGPWVNRGTVHELFGMGVILIGAALVLALAYLLRPRLGQPTRPSRAVPLLGVVRRLGAAASLLAGGCVACIAAALLGRAAATAQVAAAPLDDIPRRIGPWVGEDDPIDPYVTAQLTYDRALHRIYRNAVGHRVQVWVVYWSAVSAVRGYHHPDVCWPNRGWAVREQHARIVEPVPGVSLPLTLRRFQRAGQRQVVVYWTQEGRRVWNDADERGAIPTGPQHGWVADRLLSRRPPGEAARLMVLAGSEVWDGAGYADGAIEEFARDFAAELYRTCPWSLPATGQ